MSALPPDYDVDPDRAGSFRLHWQEDVHAPVAARLVAEDLAPVLDVGCGIGRFATALGGRLAWVGLDASPGQLAACSHAPVVRADAARMPCGEGSMGAVVLLWMLYHLPVPRAALEEARRVLRPGGLLAACAASRTSDPELAWQGYPATTFDAEEAPDRVAEVFGTSRVEVERWDQPMVELADRDEALAYARSHLLPPSVVERVDVPLTLTKRGCLVWARR